MAVRIRLTRKGKKKQPTYRVVVADGRSPRDGRYLEQIGRYDPRQEPSIVEIDNERANYWLSVGAQPSDAVRKLLEISGALEARPVKIKDAKVHVVEEAAQASDAEDDEAVAADADAVDAAVVEAPDATPDAAEGAVVPDETDGGDDGGEEVPEATEAEAASDIEEVAEVVEDSADEAPDDDDDAAKGEEESS